MEKTGMSFASWFLIILIIAGVGVGVYFLWPKANYNDAFNNVCEFKTLMQTEVSEQKNLDTFSAEIKNLCNEKNLTKRASQLEILNKIISAEQNLNSTILRALLVIDNKSKNYSNLNNKQNKALENCQKSYQALLSYIKGPFSEFLKVQQPNSALVMEYADPFIEKYKNFVLKVTEFYSVSAEITKECAKLSIETNNLTVTTSKALTDAAVRVLNFKEPELEKFSNFATQLLEFSILYNSLDFYLNYYASTPTYTIELINTQMSKIAPTSTGD